MVAMTRILVWAGKYGHRYYDASTAEKLERSARAIVATLVKDGWIYEPDEPRFDSEELEAEALTEAELASMPEFARERATSLRKAVKARRQASAEEREDYERATELAEGKSPLTTFRARTRHRDDEWDELVAAVMEKYPDAVHEGNVIYRPGTAWGLLQERDGAEYESYSVETVTTFED